MLPCYPTTSLIQPHVLPTHRYDYYHDMIGMNFPYCCFACGFATHFCPVACWSSSFLVCMIQLSCANIRYSLNNIIRRTPFWIIIRLSQLPSKDTPEGFYHLGVCMRRFGLLIQCAAGKTRKHQLTNLIQIDNSMVINIKPIIVSKLPSVPTIFFNLALWGHDWSRFCGSQS